MKVGLPDSPARRTVYCYVYNVGANSLARRLQQQHSMYVCMCLNGMSHNTLCVF